MVDKGMKEFTTNIQIHIGPEIISMTPDEFNLVFRKLCGWKYLNDFDPNYFRKHGDQFPVVLIRKNNPCKKAPHISFYNWLTYDN